jgi:hypothetical protein
MKAALPADLLKLKAQFEAWRKHRPKQGPIPEHLRQAAIALLERCSASLICRVLRLHPRTLQTPLVSKAPHPAAAKAALDFFPLLPAPPQTDLFSSRGAARSDCRLLLERPDGSRLMILLPALETATLTTLCANFLHSGRP